MAMTLISRTTLTGTAASVTFSSIPQTYQTLKLVISSRVDYAGISDGINMRPNGSTSNGSYRNVYGNGASAGSGNAATAIRVAQSVANNATASTFSNCEVIIPNYSGSNNKAISGDNVGETNGTTAYQELEASLWSATPAITSITLVPDTGPNFLANSTFSLYGVS